LRETPKTLNVLMAGNKLKPPYLLKGGELTARGHRLGRAPAAFKKDGL